MTITLRDGRNHAVFHHMDLDHPIDMMMESHGTQKLINIFPLIYQAFQTGGVAVIDDLGTASHP